MKTSQLHYPIIIFGRTLTGTFDVCLTEASLLMTTPLTLTKKMHLNSVVVDMTGCQYVVESVQRVNRGKLSDLFDDVLNRPIEMRMTLSDGCIMLTVSEVASRVRSAFGNATFADVWETSGVDSNMLNAFLGSVTTVSEIISFLAQERES